MEDNLEMIEIKWNSKIKMGIVNDYNIVEQMRDNYKIVCEPIGTPAISRKQNKLLIGPYMIKEEKNFLNEFENNKNNILYLVYKDLHLKDYFVIPGNKYGVDFLVYKNDPNFVHSTYLISCKKVNENIDVKNMINNERVSLGTLKALIYAFIDNKNEDDIKINYINISWTQI